MTKISGYELLLAYTSCSISFLSIIVCLMSTMENVQTVHRCISHVHVHVLNECRVSFRNFAKGGNREETKHLGRQCENCTILSYMYMSIHV